MVKLLSYGKINVSEEKIEIACYGVPRESALNLSVFLGAKFPMQPLLPAGSDC